MSYLEFARQVKATNKFKTVLTAAVRLHCTAAGLWLYAARWALEVEADMSSARSYMQRGTRFCTQDMDLWLEYAKLEMIYIAKVTSRRRILGIDGSVSTQALEVNPGEIPEDPGLTTSEDVISILDSETQIHPSTLDKVDVDAEAISDPMQTPALNGAIPLAIFDHAKKQPFYNADVAEVFFNMFSAFLGIAALPKIIQHVVDSMMDQFPEEPSTWVCFLKQPAVGIHPLSAEFPTALLESLERLKTSLNKVDVQPKFSKKIEAWLVPILALKDLDPGIDKVLRFHLRKLQ